MHSPVRRGWLREVFPAHLFPKLDLLPDAPNPPLDSAPAEIHDAYCREILGGWNVCPDAVYTSEDYGEGFAAALGATHRMVDRPRQQFPVSGTALRADIHGLRHFLNPLVYAHFTERVVILGAESTGKSTLVRTLAGQFGTVHVREYGRDVYERENGQLTPAHFLSGDRPRPPRPGTRGGPLGAGKPIPLQRHRRRHHPDVELFADRAGLAAAARSGERVQGPLRPRLRVQRRHRFRTGRLAQQQGGAGGAAGAHPAGPAHEGRTVHRAQRQRTGAGDAGDGAAGVHVCAHEPRVRLAYREPKADCPAALKHLWPRAGAGEVEAQF